MAQAEDLREPLTSYSVDVLHCEKKTSFVWKHFGKLVLTREGKRKHIFTEKIFCKPCFTAGGDKKNVPEDDQNPDEPDSDVEADNGPITLARFVFVAIFKGVCLHRSVAV
jgi:hypothetical protein